MLAVDVVDEELIARWIAAAERIGGQRSVRLEGERLLAAYAKPHRHYHDVSHLRTVLDRVDLLDLYARDADVVRVAAWFHDAVYDPDRAGNETASALLAETVLDRMDVEEDVVAEVSRLVRLTADHAVAPDDRDGHVLCDADLAVLGGAQDEYVSYAASVRLEYAHVSDESFAVGRSEVLQAILDRPRIYRTPTARDMWETRARANLSQEIEFLAHTSLRELPPTDEPLPTGPPQEAPPTGKRRRRGGAAS
jgi:predicted metal-dependent HD superfamily phosphohydrolase